MSAAIHIHGAIAWSFVCVCGFFVLAGITAEISERLANRKKARQCNWDAYHAELRRHNG
jgi:hypothetical protein